MSKLFVSDDEADEVMDSVPDFSNPAELDDPVITEIPLILKSKPSTQHISVLQYPGRPPRRQLVGNSRVLESRIKPSTDLIEVDVPIDTTKFFDEEKSVEWKGVNKQTLTGVLSQLDGYYAAQVQDGEIVLVPVDAVAQMRPSLKYIDEKEASKKKENQKNAEPQQHTAQVIQMSVKGTNDTAPRLGGALLARKKVEEENYKVLPWTDITEEQAAMIREDLMRASNKQALHSDMTEDEYINMLVKDTIVTPAGLK